MTSKASPCTCRGGLGPCGSFGVLTARVAPHACMCSLPLHLGSATNGFDLLSLGTVVYDRPAYHVHNTFFPVGFKTGRFWNSMHTPDTRVYYISEVVDGGEKPLFRITAEDDPTPVEATSASAAWKEVLTRENAIRRGNKRKVPCPEERACVVRFAVRTHCEVGRWAGAEHQWHGAVRSGQSERSGPAGGAAQCEPTDKV